MATNNRASFLANLRTGGVRSTSTAIPQTAAPNASSFSRIDLPMSASINGSFQPTHAQVQAQVQAQAQAQAQVFQMQMMQMEIIRLQTIQQAQAQQYQLELARQQQQQINLRASQYVEPATAGPAPVTFPRSRPSQAEQLKAQLHLNKKNVTENQQFPMTAALDGKFGGRLNPNAASFQFGNVIDETSYAPRKGIDVPSSTPPMARHINLSSGGSQYGQHNGAAIFPSKSEVSLSWRRPSSSTVNGNRVASLNVKITPPPPEGSPTPVTPTISPHIFKNRPQPLHFSNSVNQSLPVVSIDTSDVETSEEVEDTSSSSSNKSDSSPPTPRTSSSTGSSAAIPALSIREEASKRLYESLGIDRHAPQTAQILMNDVYALPSMNDQAVPIPASATITAFRVNCQPVRQPRGPPSGADELGPKNFATRIRRRAISGLEAMMDANMARREIEAF